MAARLRGQMTKTIILAHQVAVMQGHANSKKGLRQLDFYLKPIERSRKRRRKVDQSELVAAVLERRAAKGATSPPAAPPHTNPGAPGGKKPKRPRKD